MQWIGEAIEARIGGSLDAGLEPATASDFSVSFARELLRVLQAMQEGDFSVRMSGDRDGLSGEIAQAVNVLAAAHQRVMQQLERAGEEVGREGRTRQRIKLGLSGGGWGEMEDQINALIDDLVWPAMAVTRAITAAARGDLTQTVALDRDGHLLKGDFLQMATIVNAMIRQLNTSAAELARAAEVERRAAENAAELEQSKRRLHDSEETRKLALAAGRMGSWDWDLTGGRWLWDEGQKQIFGADPISFEAALPNIRALVDRDDWKPLCQQLNRARRHGGAAQLEFRVRQPDGGIRWCFGTAVAVRDATGRVSRIRGITMDITERKEAEDRQSLLAREVDHRTKNALAVVHAIVSLTRSSDTDQFSATVEGRVQALARAHSLLSEARWRGARIDDLIQGEFASFRALGPERLRMSGRSLSLHPSAVQALALAVHELAANAAMHGALSGASGTVQVAWEQQGDELDLRWTESGGPAPRSPAPEEGLGMRIIRASVETQLSGAVAIDWLPDGLQCAIRVPCHPKTELFGNFLFSIQPSGQPVYAWQEAGLRRRMAALS